MWLLTSAVSTVPGTVAAYQPAVLKAGAETSAPACGTLAASCNCQTVATAMGADGAAWAEAATGDRSADIDTRARETERPKRICKGFNPRFFFGRVCACMRRTHGLYRLGGSGIAAS